MLHAADTSITKVDSTHSPKGEKGQTYLASGVHVSMRMWLDVPPRKKDEVHTRPYETVGFVIKGKARLHFGDQVITLEEGDSWVVPKDAPHAYEILEPLTAIEATCPPSAVHGRDQ